MRIIPAIDLIDGKCVRLSQGDYATQKVYSDNPLEMAKQFEGAGIQFLHLVDLDGAKSGSIVNHKILEQIATKTNLKVDFGGGLKSTGDAKIAFESGANQITGGSIAVKNPTVFLEWLSEFSSDKIILGADCKNRKIATNGWFESSELDVVAFISDYLNKGINYVISTDIEMDGMLNGPSFELYEELVQLDKLKLIASGGVSSMDDLFKLKAQGCEGAIIGKAFYEGRITLNELSELC